jgi:hypothetical protein
MKIKVTMTIELPKPPNFLRDSDGRVVPLCAITDDGLRMIGKQWTEALIARAAEQQKQADAKRKAAVPGTIG